MGVRSLGWTLLVVAQLAVADEILPERVVTAPRVVMGPTAVGSALTVLDATDLERSGTLTLDDALRSVAGFSLFRRSSSLTAHPTTQGVSLRGLGGSGASRTLVLLDGVPLNDPFGGWVPWALVPVNALDRVEIVRGAGVGGTIHLLSVQPTGPYATVVAEGGTEGTARGELSVGTVSGPFALRASAGHRRTDGYPVVRADQRGPIDQSAGAADTNFDARLAYRVGLATTAALHVAALDEQRGNGTPYTDNASRMVLSDLTLQYRPSPGDLWHLAVWGRTQRFQSRFSAVGPPRVREQPAVDQFAVPATAAGGSASWEHGWRDDVTLLAGVDGAFVDGETNEDARYSDGHFMVRRRAGGQSLTGGVFASLRWAPLPALQWMIGGRVDGWQRRRLVQQERSLATGLRTLDRHPRGDSTIAPSPALGVRFAPAPWATLRAAVGGGMRVPTLNELTRSFRVRQDQTVANPHLRPERSISSEVGGDLTLGRATASLTAYWLRLDDAIANVTVTGAQRTLRCRGLPAAGRCAERRNLDRIDGRGVELDGRWALSSTVGAHVSYAWQDARVRAGGDRELDGRRSPQVPLHSATAGLGYDDPAGALAAVEVRYIGRQYDDDRNRHPLGGVVTVNAQIGWHLTPHWQVFLQSENLFDRTVPVGRSDVTAIGAPRLVHGGFQLTF